MIGATTAVVAAAGLTGLAAIYARDLRREKSRRGSAFEGCRGKLASERLTLEDNGYPRLTGVYEGLDADIRLAVDTIQLRKLPVLWLMVTVKRPLPVNCVVDVMTRATNAEIFSPHNDLPASLPLPEGWPGEINIRTDDPAAAQRVAGRLSDCVQAFVSDQRGKEMLVTPRGVRLVYRLCESDRGHYLLTRLPRFDGDRVPFETVRSLLEQAERIAENLEESGNEQRA